MIDTDGTKSISQQSTPSSDENNSPTELNTYKRLFDKPPLIKRLAMGLTGNSPVGNGNRDLLTINQEDEDCPLVFENHNSIGASPTTNRPSSGGYINEGINESDTQRSRFTKLPATEALDNSINSSLNAKNFPVENIR